MFGDLSSQALNVVAIYDNDAEGLSACQRTRELGLPPTYRVAILPNRPEFSTFPTVGPTGVSHVDINGRAAAIECYLDLTRSGLPSVQVRWGAYNERLKVYQGVLEGKTQFMKDFLDYKGAPDRHGSYDLRKMASVIEMILGHCVDIASAKACRIVSTRLR